MMKKNQIQQIIRIEEVYNNDKEFIVIITINHNHRFPVHFINPINENELKLLEWYFETFYFSPFWETEKAKIASSFLKSYGESLVKQLFYSNSELKTIYSDIVLQNYQSLRFEVVGSTIFNSIFWELLKDPNLEQPFSIIYPFVRILEGANKCEEITLDSFPVLIVSARTNIEDDILHTLISRPLIEISENSEYNFKIDILRPPTFQSLKEHLERIRCTFGDNYYQIIHFDTHGGFLNYNQYKICKGASFYNCPIISPFNGFQPFIFLESQEENEIDPVSADKLSLLLSEYNIPIIFLNACESGKNIDDFGSNFSTVLLNSSGCKAVLGMRFSISSSSAKTIMEIIYEGIFSNKTLSDSILNVRRHFHKQTKVLQGEETTNDEWFIPVLYEKTTLSFHIKERKNDILNNQTKLPLLIGRDRDIIRIESLIFKNNEKIIPIFGEGGIGKTIFAQFLSRWWQLTGLITDFIYLNVYDQNIDNNIANYVINKFSSKECDLKIKSKESIINVLLKKRILIVFDDFDKVSHSVIKDKLIEFTKQCQKTPTIFLFVMRENCFEDFKICKFTYRLGELDSYSFYNLAKKGLESIGKELYSTNQDFYHLMNFANGNPSCLLRIIDCLKQETPKELIRFIYGENSKEELWNNLYDIQQYYNFVELMNTMDFEVCTFWKCLSRFTHTIHTSYLDSFFKIYGCKMATEKINDALIESIRKGLLVSYSEFPRCFRLHPYFHSYMKKYFSDNQDYESLEKSETAYLAFYNSYIYYYLLPDLMQLDSRDKRQETCVLIKLQIENIKKYIVLTVAKNQPISFLLLISEYYKASRQPELFIYFAELIEELFMVKDYQATKQFKLNLLIIKTEKARHLMDLKKYDDALEIYEYVKKYIDTNFDDEESLNALIKLTNVNIGIAYRYKNEWETAEKYYLDSLKIEDSDIKTHTDAGVFLDLAIVCREQEKYAEAEVLIKESLKLLRKKK